MVPDYLFSLFCGGRRRSRYFHLLRLGRFDLEDFDGKEQRLAGQRMIQVNNDRVLLHLRDLGKHHLAVRATALESFPDATRLFGNTVLGHFLDAIRVNLAVSFRGRNFDVLGIPDF